MPVIWGMDPTATMPNSSDKFSPATLYQMKEIHGGCGVYEGDCIGKITTDYYVGTSRSPAILPSFSVALLARREDQRAHQKELQRPRNRGMTRAGRGSTGSFTAINYYAANLNTFSQTPAIKGAPHSRTPDPHAGHGDAAQRYAVSRRQLAAAGSRRPRLFGHGYQRRATIRKAEGITIGIGVSIKRTCSNYWSSVFLIGG
eukprot:109294-Pyramimonas_sp.AAC.1